MQLETELRSCSENIVKTKNTCSLYKFKDLVDKCIQDKKINNRDTIVECIQKLNGLIPSKLIGNLLNKAIEIDDYDLCLLFINNVQILEECQAVDCLKYFLKEYNNDSLVQIEKNLEMKLDVVFKKAFDYRLLSTELKRLSSNEFIICLLYLQNYVKQSFFNKQNQLNDDSADTEINQQLNEKDNKNDISISNSSPNILQITDLFCCFVDAHFTHITLSGKAQEIIADVLQLIETQLDVFFDLVSIESLIKEIKQNNEFQVKNNNNIGHYYIEVLKFA